MPSLDPFSQADFTNYVFRGSGLTTRERNWGRARFQAYKDHNHIDSPSDLQVLEDLVFNEALSNRYKQNIELLSKELEKVNKKADPKAQEQVPIDLIDTLTSVRNEILKLKTKLGFFAERTVKDPFEKFKVLEKKQEKWMDENLLGRESVCADCGQMQYLKIRTEHLETIKHPFFRDKVLMNEHLWKLYEEKKITKLDIAKVLLGSEATSTDYVDWLEQKFFK